MGKSNTSYRLRIRDLPEEEKPREKLRKYGPASLKNYELMAVILGKGTRKEGILELSKRIMSQYGDQAVFSQGDVDTLKNEWRADIGVKCPHCGDRHHMTVGEAYVQAVLEHRA